MGDSRNTNAAADSAITLADAWDLMIRSEALFRLLIRWFGAADWTGPAIDVDLARGIDRWFADYETAVVRAAGDS